MNFSKLKRRDAHRMFSHMPPTLEFPKRWYHVCIHKDIAPILLNRANPVVFPKALKSETQTTVI